MFRNWSCVTTCPWWRGWVNTLTNFLLFSWHLYELLKNWSWISYKEDQPKCLSFWWDFCCRVWFCEAFLFVWGTLFLYFLSSPFVWWCPLPIFPITCDFHFLQAFWFFLDLAVIFLPLFVFFHFSWWAWHIFLCQIPFLYILAIYSYCLYEGTQFFFILCKQLDVIHLHKVTNLFLQLSKFVVPCAFPKYVIKWHHCYYK